MRNFLAALILPLTNTPYGYIIIKKYPIGYNVKQVIFWVILIITKVALAAAGTRQRREATKHSVSFKAGSTE